MKRALSMTASLLSCAVLLLATHAVRAADFDAEAAKALADDNECSKCHSMDKTKKGPSLKKIAAKYKGKPAAETEAKLVKHLTSGEKVKLEDGSEEDHKIIETKDEAQIRNLIRWILSL
jgi:cytochrome c